MSHRLLSLIAPPLCGICGDRCGSAAPICERCAAEIATARPLSLMIPGAHPAVAAAPYEGVPRRLVTALKFGKRLALAAVAAEAMDGLAAQPGTVVPVPPDPWRLRLRGFDPAALIAAELAERLDLPLSHCLARAHGRRQVGKARAQRLTAGPEIKAGGNAPPIAILVDDVVTTGATLTACARALRASGAEEVLALAFTRA